ncbi:murein biosynthesis integral membrane protein MurJ [Sporichthya sp.]|uniref:murein biosynthesis integral membrane protein MurJ n=1 Tax=Sporichthya sp. TaxID=65475 RepID=UPI001844C037|nr:murein biosynthesis integral membrane protein MurJ [Sporichthya sp.]MBA3741675.1 murein biosynthesis integral membrane protein MurJ [Sporichthya sp.]
MTGEAAEPSITRSSAVMAAGTVVSRITGFGRDLVLTWAIGTAAFSVTYNVANTVPNIIYILLAGGVLNAVFVPQLVKAMREDADGGKAFADRLLTAVGIVLLVITAVAVVFAPLVISAYAYAFTHGEGSAANFDVAVTFARYFLPQIFFYGLHVMLGQVLNARGRFGPMMFAPILNNLVVIATGVMFLVVTSGENPTTESISSGEIRLLGIGTTLGVIVQALALLPFLKASGYRYKPRFDLRGTGLGQAYRLATWTLLFVLVNQIAYLVVVQIATGIEETAAADGYPGRGFTPYTKAYLIMLLPHAVITVSVVTALLPRMARAVTDARFDDVRADLAGGLKLTGAALIPAAVAFGVLGPSMAVLGFGHGNTSVANAQYIGYVLAGFALALVPFSVHHQLLRGFYAFSDTRTPVTINVWIAGTNIALALACVSFLPARWVAVGLAVSYAASYAVGVVISARKLGRYLGPLDSDVIRTYDRMLVASILAAVPAVVIGEIAYRIWGTGTTAAAVTVIGGGGTMLLSYLVITTRMRVTEVTQLLGPLLRRG